MKELRTEIEIQASAEKVWKILTDLDKYPDWNPFIHHAIGTAKVINFGANGIRRLNARK